MYHFTREWEVEFMARLQRIAPKNIPIHIIQRGNNRQVCFRSDDDHAAYAAWLKEYSKKYMVDIHAWVMMTNHLHLLCNRRQEKGVSFMMQALGLSICAHLTLNI